MVDKHIIPTQFLGNLIPNNLIPNNLIPNKLIPNKKAMENPTPSSLEGGVSDETERHRATQKLLATEPGQGPNDSISNFFKQFLPTFFRTLILDPSNTHCPDNLRTLVSALKELPTSQLRDVITELTEAFHSRQDSSHS